MRTPTTLAVDCGGGGIKASVLDATGTLHAQPVRAATPYPLPPERLLVETDSPYLAPEPVRGRRNEPANVRFVLEKLAELRGMAPEEMAALTMKNAMTVYGPE